MKKAKPKKGQIVFICQKKGEKLVRRAVTKSGTKFFYLGTPGAAFHLNDTKYLLQNWREVHWNKGYGDHCFASKAEYREYKEEQALVTKIRDTFFYLAQGTYSLDQLKRIRAITEEGK